MNILTEKDFTKAQLESIFFDRPVSPLRRHSVAILVGRHSSLYEIERLYEIVRAMNYYPVLIADSQLKPLNIPAEIYLTTDKKKYLYQNTAEAMAIIASCHSVIAGVGLELNSAMQVFLDKILRSFTGIKILTRSSLTLPNIRELIDHRTLMIASSDELIGTSGLSKLPKTAGLLQKINTLYSIYSESQPLVVCIDASQAIGFDFLENRVGVVNIDTKIDPVVFMVLLSCLVMDPGQLSSSRRLDYLFATGYLYKNIYLLSSNPAEALKTYFDFN